MTVRRLGWACCVAGILAFGMPAVHAAQAKPANATAKCKDGTYSTAKTKRGACASHGGVETWYDEAKDATKTAAKDTKDAAKVAAKDTEKGSKAAAKETEKGSKAAAKETKSATEKTKDAVTPTGTIDRPADAPATATGVCNDGTYTSAKNHRGACSNHKGVKAWFKA